MRKEAFFPDASIRLLCETEAFFVNRVRMYPSLEAVVQFGSSLRRRNPKDVDFFVVSDDPNLKNAESWRAWEEADYRFLQFRLDFFFRVGTTLDPAGIDSIRLPGPQNYDRDILRQVTLADPCIVYTREASVEKYKEAFPKSLVVYIPD